MSFKKLSLFFFSLVLSLVIAVSSVSAATSQAFTRPTLSVIPQRISERIEAGQEEKAFTIRSRGATRFQIVGNPVAATASGITWSKTSGNFVDGESEIINIKVSENTIPGEYSGTASVIDPDNSSKSYPLTIKVRVTPKELVKADIRKAFVLPCTSTSCPNITTVVVQGKNFTSQSRIELEFNGQKYNQSTNLNANPDAMLVGGNGQTEIIMDFFSLPNCRNYTLTVYDPTLQSDSKRSAIRLPCP